MKKPIQSFVRGVLVASVVCLAVALGTHWVRGYLVEQNEILVHELAQEVLPALLTNDSQQVEAVLKSLESRPGVLRVDLVSSEGASIASLGRVGDQLNKVDSPFELASAEVGAYEVQVMAPVSFDSLILANLHLAVSLWPAYLKLIIWIGTLLIVPSVLYVLIRSLGLKIRLETGGFEDGGNSDRGAKFDVHTALDQALKDAQITVEYQPLHRMSDAGVCGVELVVCWRHPSGQTIHMSPADFAFLAKKWGIFLPVDAWIIKTALKQMSFWQRHFGPLVMSFNLSEAQLTNPDFLESLKVMADDVAFPFHLIELELSESNLLKHPDEVAFLFNQGLGLTVDGFGLSSQSKMLLRQGYAGKVKLDHKLVARMDHDVQIKLLIAEIAEVAMANNVQVAADGVNARVHLESLKALGCAFGQGRYFAAPLSAKDCDAYLARMSNAKYRAELPQKQGATTAVSVASGK